MSSVQININMDNTTYLNLSCENLTCVLCFEIYTKPYKVSCVNEHTFCLNCIMRAWDVEREEDLYNMFNRTKKSCPTCRDPAVIQETRPDNSMRRMVSNIQQQCKYAKNGCKWFCEPGSPSFEEHAITCR